MLGYTDADLMAICGCSNSEIETLTRKGRLIPEKEMTEQQKRVMEAAQKRLGGGKYAPKKTEG